MRLQGKRRSTESTGNEETARGVIQSTEGGGTARGVIQSTENDVNGVGAKTENIENIGDEPGKKKKEL